MTFHHHAVNSLRSTFLQRVFGNFFNYELYITIVNVKKCNCDCYSILFNSLTNYSLIVKRCCFYRLVCIDLCAKRELNC